MYLDELEELIRREDVNVYSLCAYENGKYDVRAIRQSNEKNNVYSASKSITSLIFGILAEQGLVSAEGESVAQIFRGRDVPERWNAVTPAHVLMQKTGFGAGFLDIDSDGPEGWPKKDYLDLTLEHPFVHRPGEVMAYSDSNYYLLSRIITEKTGRGLHDLAREMIFNPLNIVGTAWATCPLGYAMGATGLFLSVTDMARIGVMLLQDGVWEGKQIVPRAWIAEMTKMRTQTDPSGGGYGYGFWLQKGSRVFSAGGMLGQAIRISPETGRVTAILSCEHDGEKFGKVMGLLAKLDRKS